jgi:hypothetical protein
VAELCTANKYKALSKKTRVPRAQLLVCYNLGRRSKRRGDLRTRVLPNNLSFYSLGFDVSQCALCITARRMRTGSYTPTVRYVISSLRFHEEVLKPGFAAVLNTARPSGQTFATPLRSNHTSSTLRDLRTRSEPVIAEQDVVTETQVSKLSWFPLKASSELMPFRVLQTSMGSYGRSVRHLLTFLFTRPTQF